MIDNHNTPPSKDGEEKDPLFDKQLSDLSRRVTLEVPVHIRELVLEDALKTLLPLDMPLEKTVVVPPDNVWRRWGLGMGLAASVMLGLNVFWQVESTAPGSLTRPIEPEQQALPVNPEPALPQIKKESKVSAENLPTPPKEPVSEAAKPSPSKLSKPTVTSSEKMGSKGFPSRPISSSGGNDSDSGSEEYDQLLQSYPKSEIASQTEEKSHSERALALRNEAESSLRREIASQTEKKSSEFTWGSWQIKRFKDMKKQLELNAGAPLPERRYAFKHSVDPSTNDKPIVKLLDTYVSILFVFNQWAGEPVSSVQTADGFKISGWRYWPVVPDQLPQDLRFAVIIGHHGKPNPDDIVLDEEAIHALVTQKDIANSPLSRIVDFEATCKSANCKDEQEQFSREAMELDIANGKTPWKLMRYVKRQ